MLGGAWVIGLLLAPSAERVQLQWDVPDGCPQRPEVLAAIERALPPADFDAASAPLRARGRIRATDDGFLLALQIGDGAAPRELRANRCAELAATAALIVAISVDPRASGAPPPDPPRDDPDGPRADGWADARGPRPEVPDLDPGGRPLAAQTGAQRPVAPRELEDERAPGLAARSPRGDGSAPRVGGRGVGLVGRVHIGVGAGLAPRAAAVVGVSVASVVGRARIELDANYWTPRRRTSPRNPDVGVSSQAWTLGARGCGVLGRRRVGVPLCGVVQGGRLHGIGRGALEPTRAAVPWLGAGAGTMVLVRVARRLSVGCAIDVLASLVRGGFRTEPSGDVDRVDAVAIAANCGIQWHGVLESPAAGQSRR